MLEALKKTLGIVTEACELTGIARATHYNWLDNDPEYKLACEQMVEIALDYSESALRKAIDKGSVKAITFHLDRKGKRRGYGLKTEITGANGTPLISNAPDFSHFTVAELEELLKKDREAKK